MKKKVYIILVIILVLIIFAGIITNYIDSSKVTTNHEPKFCIKIISNDGRKVTYWGLGYKVIRYVGISPNEPYESNIGTKMGSWFMEYELSEAYNIEIEYEGETITVTNIKEIGIIENILVNSKYNNELCDGINTHKITINDDVYYIKEYCKEIQKDSKQATISEEDLETINKIISNNKSQKVSTFTRTYNVLNIAESNDEEYLYLTIRQFQEEEIKTIKVQNDLANNVKIGNSYEFIFQYTDNIIEDNIEAIFENAILIEIKETDKQGLEQIQDLVE